MKTSVKFLAIFVALSLILNSCSVYHTKEASFNEAYLSKKPVKLITNEDRKVKLKKIVLKDSTYYGVYYDNGKKIEFPMSQKKYKSLKIKNRTASTVLNVTGTVVILGAVLIVIAAVSVSDLNFNFGPTKNQNPTYKN